jgi:peptidoglycan glycosyltransferase
MINRRIRWLALVLVACFGLLFLQLNNFQVREASKLVANPANTGNATDALTLPRGDIYSSDGVVLAYSKATSDYDGEFRVYPTATAKLFAGITGYESVAVGSETGMEAEYNTYLEQHNSPVTTLGELLTAHKETDDVTLTASVALQSLAAKELAGRTGAVVAIDPQTGAILAMYGNPTYNPNLFSVHNYSKVMASYDALIRSSTGDALINYATGQAKAPGSTFKVVDSAAIYDHDTALENKWFPTETSITLPDSAGELLNNFDSESCGGYLAQILARSCDTAFALVGETLGATNLYEEATAFGFNQVPPIDLPAWEVAASNFPTPKEFAQDVPGLMKSAIGQENVTATTLQMALVAAGIADNGAIMTPHLLSKVIDDQGKVVKSYRLHIWKRATSAKTAQAVRSLMLGVTQDSYGTAYGLFGGVSVPVAAKTGTAEINANGCGTYDWLIAMAPAGAGETPTVAVAAIVPTPSGSSCSNDATGAVVAGPVVAAVLAKALEMER